MLKRLKRNIFQDACHAAEGEIYTKLNQKIDEFIQLADYEWGMAESDGRASGYLMDLINFLRSTFQVFTHLPVSLVILLTSDPLNLSLFSWYCGIAFLVFRLILAAVKWFVSVLIVFLLS